jgi:hypothetical protein
VVEGIPTNIPEPRDNPIQTTVFIDAGHAGNVITRRSKTGVLMHFNRVHILWYSKKQNCVESSTFGSEYISLRIGIEIVKKFH